MIIDDIREELFRLQDVQYRDFQSRLIPSANFWTRSRIFILMRISCTPFFSRK